MFVYRSQHLRVDHELIFLSQTSHPVFLQLVLIVGNHQRLHVGVFLRTFLRIFPKVASIG